MHRTCTGKSALLLSAALLISAYPVAGQDTYVVHDLAPGVFAAVAPKDVPPYLFANSLVAIGDSGVLVVDSGQRPALARELIALIRERTELPVRWVVNTHWHGDHVWGNQVFLDSFPGVRILSTPATRDSVSASSARQVAEQVAQQQEGRARLQAMLDTADAHLRNRIRQADSVRLARIAELQAIRVVPPTRLFTERLELDLGGRTAVLLPLGPAHTPGDAAVWLPDARIVGVGDLLEEGELWLEGADVAAWRRALETLAALGARVLVPAHGSPSADGALLEAGRAQLIEASVLEVGRQLTESFMAGDLEPLWNRMTPDMRDAAGGSLSAFGDFREKVAELAGGEVEVLEEEVLGEEDVDVYRRLSAFTEAREPMVVQWTVARDGAIAEFFIRPAEPAAAVVYETKTELHLPFEGEWYVTAGGRTVEQNHHSLDYSNRFAYDLVRADEFGRSQPSVRNEDFATWGKPILAPAAGTVAAVRSSVPDNAPGEINDDPSVRMGNFVSIDHGNGEFSVLGHLKEGSVRVRVGDRLGRGEVIGLAGNSGNSNGPHLHYNLQDRADPNRGKGLPAQFVSLVVDGEFIGRGEPVQGQRIRASGVVAQDPPDPRAHHQVVYHGAENRVYLLGGSTPRGEGHHFFDDIWLWRGDAWQRVGSLPFPRSSHRVAYHSGRKSLVLFGGGSGRTFTADSALWEWDGADWNPLGTSQFGGLAEPGMCYDRKRSRIVLFGGWDGTNRLNGDTWEWTGDAFVRLDAAGPSARGGHVFVYDPNRERCLLFGGLSEEGVLSDTWEWDGTGWQRIETSGPSARWASGAATDHANGRVILFSGWSEDETFLDDTWLWDGEKWELVSSDGPPPRIGGQLAFTGDGVLLFGGRLRPADGFRDLNDTWQLRGSEWVRIR